MREFSRTILPPNLLGLLDTIFPALVRVGSFLWMHTTDYSYMTDDGTVHLVKAGETTDLASIPRAFWNLYPPFGLYTGPATIHDSLYRKQYTDKATADHLFAEMMDCAKVDHRTRMILYDGVKLGGQAACDGHTKEINDRKLTNIKL